MSNNNSTNDYNEREGRGLELYDQGKSTREIAKELRMSLRDIGIILKKGQINHGVVTIMGDGNNSNSNNNKPAIEKATQAYKLFSQGKKPLEVAIELGLREKQVNSLFREFWKLKRQYRLYQIYPEIEHCLPSFLKLHRVLKGKGLNPDNVEWFVNAMENGTIQLPELQGQYQNLQNKVQTEHYQKQKLEQDLQVIQRQIIELTDIERLHQQNFDTIADKILCLQMEVCTIHFYCYHQSTYDNNIYACFSL
ncbi:MAG: hypothetical protein WBZ20_03170 [Nitrososphaeraceae archaeon]